MGRLFQAKKKNAQQIIDNFTEDKIKIDAFCDALNVLQNKLYTANNRDEFDNVVQMIINEERKVHRFLLELTKGTNEESMSKVKAYMADLPKFKNVMTLLNYTETTTKNIIAKKELLSLQEASFNLSETQQTELFVFINKLKELKPVAELLVSQQNHFKELLHEATSLETIDEIENEIQNRNHLLNGALERLLPYPKDEQVSEQIIEVLKKTDIFSLYWNHSICMNH